MATLHSYCHPSTDALDIGGVECGNSTVQVDSLPSVVLRTLHIDPSLATVELAGGSA